MPSDHHSVRRFQVSLPRFDDRALQREAHARGRSMTELLRRIVAEHLAAPGGPRPLAKGAVLRLVGLGAGGRPDVSARHDDAWR